MKLILKPKEIEEKSFEIITSTLGDIEYDRKNINVLKRVIHTTADFEYVDNLNFSENVVDHFRELIKNDVTIVTDTQMAMAGVNKVALAKAGIDIKCFISNEEVANNAKKNGVTRSIEAVKYAVDNIKTPIIFVVGNAPTSLLKICELVDTGIYKSGLIIAVPVGFVNVVESKEMIIERHIPHIVARGRKGGSNVAAAIVNALVYDVVGRD